MAPSVVITAFLEYLVDPLLPAKASIRDSPTIFQRRSVAKQVHSVVLLYNYFHRKQHPELAFLAFHEFCKLVVAQRPNLSAHMKFTQKPEETELVNVMKQLSLAEQKIMEACNICRSLDTSSESVVPNIVGWTISKVAVLLVDNKMENCFLFFGSITEGVWSLIEREVDASDESSVASSGIKTYKRRKAIKMPPKDEFDAGEDDFRQVGYYAVKKAAGVEKTNIVLLESYTMYSHSKEKAASRFYIMKCSNLIREVNRVPIKDLIESLRGPLVTESSSSWMVVTPVIDYFHLLPYSEVISNWFCSLE